MVLLLQAQQLVALNTWHASPAHTYQQGQSVTQIDYVLTRDVTAGGIAKSACPQIDFPLGRWKTAGHLPLLAKIRPLRHWHLPGRRVKPLPHDAQALQTAVRENSARAQAMQRWVQERLLPRQTPEQWNQVLREATQTYFPAQTRTERPSQDTIAARRLWRSRRPGPDATQAEIEAMTYWLRNTDKQSNRLGRLRPQNFSPRLKPRSRLRTNIWPIRP